MDTPENLLDRPTYGIAEADGLLGLTAGTARRWIDGYSRGRRDYWPVVRPEPTGEELITWGEFVETRLLAEYREQGAAILHMRPAVERLREELNTRYPLATAFPFLDVEGRELVQRVQADVGLQSSLQFVIVRSGQLLLAPEADRYVRSAEFEEGSVVRLRPFAEIPQVFMDPLRRSGHPTVRAVPTDVIAEQFRAGTPVVSIAADYDLSPEYVEAALRYELRAAAAA
jgi:uncharacterized protein (DUF433 family)